MSLGGELAFNKFIANVTDFAKSETNKNKSNKNKSIQADGNDENIPISCNPS